MPREYWSLCGPARRPAHCSGLMKGGVPITVPSAVRVTSAERRATPKSDTITRPSESMRMFAPLTSRWTMPHAWAYASARAAARSTCKVTGTESAPRSEEHTSELQSPDHLVCRLLLEKKKKTSTKAAHAHTLVLLTIVQA